MVDTTKAIEGKYVNPDMVKGSPTKRLVILGEGTYEKGDYGEKFQMPVEIDYKQKIWSPNKDSLKNMQSAWGMDSAKWVSKIVILSTLIVRGKETVNGFPNPEEIIRKENI